MTEVHLGRGLNHLIVEVQPVRGWFCQELLLKVPSTTLYSKAHSALELGKLMLTMVKAIESSAIAVLTEKPSVARDIARVLGADKRGEGYFQGNGYLVTWAIGHLGFPATTARNQSSMATMAFGSIADLANSVATGCLRAN